MLTTNYEYFRSNKENYHYQFKCNYLKNQKHFAIILCIFRIYFKFWTFWKEMSLLAQLFLKLLTEVISEVILVRSEIFGLLVYTLTANYEYSRSNRENLPLPIQMFYGRLWWRFLGILFSASNRCLEKVKKKKSLRIGLVSLKRSCLKMLQTFSENFYNIYEIAGTKIFFS